MSLSSHFFIEQDAFSGNTVEQSFGPQSSTLFNLTTSFTLSGDKKAFSICKGIVFIQPQDGSSTKVNLILRPYNQPFSGFNVKYFIYRGLRKSDFFDGDNIIAADSTNSDFIAKIWDDFNSFYNGQILPQFLSKYIGFDESTSSPPITTLLSSFFFKESQFVEAGSVFDETDSFELPMIAQGKSLGCFASGECGIDVVLDYGDYQHDIDNSEFAFDLAYARKIKATIELLGTETDFQKKLKREQSTQFIDIVGFYGQFVKDSIINSSDSSGTISSKTGQSIYTELMMPFANKNKVYLYIDSNRSRSYNFYDNYRFSQSNPNNIKVGLLSNLVESAYANLSWPMIILESEQTTSENFNDVSVQLITSSSYEEMGMYVLSGEAITDSDRGFIIKENILDSQVITEDLNFSKVFSFKVPNIEVDGNKKSIGSIIKFIYVGNSLNISELNTEMLWEERKRYLLYNNIFTNLTITPIFNSDQNFLISSVYKSKLISYRGFSNLLNESVLNGYVVFHKGIKVVQNIDLTTETYTNERALFISKKIETLDDLSIYQPKVLSKGIHSTKLNIDPKINDFSSYFSTLYGSNDYILTHYMIDDGGIAIKLLSLSVKDQLDYCFYNLGLTKDELNTLKSIIPANSSNVDFYLQDDLNNPHVNPLSDYIPFFKYSVGIFYENANGVLTVLLPQVPIYVYGLSHAFLCSKDYSDYEEKSVTKILNNLNAVL